MNGIIVIDKPKDYTSRDIVNIVSKKLNTKKVGHTGTLDPLATGVLVLPIGRALKVSELLTSNTKEYIAEVILGYETDMLDITGTEIKRNIPSVTKEELLPQGREQGLCRSPCRRRSGTWNGRFCS